MAAGAAAGVRSTSVQDVMRRLLQRKNIMVRPPGPAAAVREAKYIAAIDILQVLVLVLRSLIPCTADAAHDQITYVQLTQYQYCEHATSLYVAMQLVAHIDDRQPLLSRWGR